MKYNKPMSQILSEMTKKVKEADHDPVAKAQDR